MVAPDGRSSGTAPRLQQSAPSHRRACGHATLIARIIRHMARDSAIEWTGHTFNPWWGCTKVSPACDHCYAEAWAKRTGFDVWGADAPRRRLGDDYWNQPLRWDQDAAQSGRRARVFCASMADVFEWDRALDNLRERLWTLIESTPNLDWLLLTKRPHLARRLKRFSNRPCTTWGGRGTSARTDAGGPMRAYSMDLRERALLDSDAGMKAADVAAKYRVSGSWVRLLKTAAARNGRGGASRPATGTARHA